MDEMDSYLAGTVHMDKAFEAARKTYALSATSQSFDEHLHVATVAMAANAVRTYLESAVEAAWREGFETADRAGRRSDRMLTTDGFWERSKARAALQAAGGKQDGR